MPPPRTAAKFDIVEWNPPSDRPPLTEALHWPSNLGPCQVRIIEVPPEVHRRHRHAAELPLFQMIGKNVGIRRARGKYVVATNIDILLSDAMVRFILEGKLRTDRMSRADRMDVMTHVPVDATVEERLAYCRSHYLHRNAREGTYRLNPDGSESTIRRTCLFLGMASFRKRAFIRWNNCSRSRCAGWHRRRASE